MDLLTPLGFGPGQRPVKELASILGVVPSALTPSALAEGRLARALALTAAHLRGELRIATVPDPWVCARAEGLLSALDAGDYSIPELAVRMRLWGMETSDDWIVRLHGAGAAQQHAIGGWCMVRSWARQIVMEGK